MLWSKSVPDDKCENVAQKTISDFFHSEPHSSDSSRHSLMPSSLLCTFCSTIMSQASSFWWCLLDFVAKREKEPPTFTGRGRSTDNTNGQPFLLTTVSNKTSFFLVTYIKCLLALTCCHFYSSLCYRNAPHNLRLTLNKY